MYVESTHSFNFSVNHIDRNLPVSVMKFCTDNASDIFLSTLILSLPNNKLRTLGSVLRVIISCSNTFLCTVYRGHSKK